MTGIKHVSMVKQFHDACEHCICSNCHLAQSNGGAPGCGNCKDCVGKEPRSNCKEYWAPMRIVSSEAKATDNVNESINDTCIAVKDILKDLRVLFSHTESPTFVEDAEAKLTILRLRVDDLFALTDAVDEINELYFDAYVELECYIGKLEFFKSFKK